MTWQYSPPEYLFGGKYAGMKRVAGAADIWALGVVWLEIILGRDDVWKLDSRSRAEVDARLKL